MLTRIKDKYQNAQNDVNKWRNDLFKYDQEIARAKGAAQRATFGPAIITGFLVLGAIMNFLGINLTDYTDAQLEEFSDPMVDPVWAVVALLGGSVAWFVLGHMNAKKRAKSANLKYNDSITKLNEYNNDMAYVKGLESLARQNLKKRLGIDGKIFGGVVADSIAQTKITNSGMEQLISGIKNNNGVDIANAKKRLGVAEPAKIKQYAGSAYVIRELTIQQQNVLHSIVNQLLQNKK